MQHTLQGSVYVPANFQAEKILIVVPGGDSILGQQPCLHHNLSLGFLMAAKASRQSASRPFHQSGLFSVSER
jgi:hypothetical protein